MTLSLPLSYRPSPRNEFSRLEQSILAAGYREAIIVAGHNRYRFCKEHHLPYHIDSMHFDDRNAVTLRMLQNQLARRNLNDFQRVELVRKCEEAIKAQARERMLAGTSETQAASNQLSFVDEPDPRVNLPQGSKSRDELGKLAGVSGSTYEHAAAVLDTAPAPVVETTRKKELSINAAYLVTKLPSEQQQEVADRIRQGETPRKVVAEVRKTSPAPQPIPEHESSLHIPFFEDIINGKTSAAELNKTDGLLLYAYKHSKRLGNAWLDIFERTFSASEAEQIAAALKGHNVQEFTIAIVFADLLDRLATFQELGFRVQKVMILRDDNMRHDSASAILLRYTPQ